MAARYYEKREHYGNGRSYPLDEYPPSRERFNDSGNPRKGYNPDFPPEQINRYEQRFYNTHYNRGRTYSDDRDYWRYNRYHDRDDLFDRPSFQRPRVNDFHDNRVYDHHNNRGYDHHDNRGYDHHDNREYEHHDNREYVNHDNRGYDFHNDRGFGLEDNDKPQIWYTRQIIEYYDNGHTRSSYDEHVGVPRHPVEPRTRERLALEEAPPSPKEAVPIIILPPEDTFTDLDEPPVAPVESVAILNDSPIESYVATSQNVGLDIDHEPEYLITEYKDLGFYALDDTDERRENASIMPRQIGDNTAYIHNEPLYATPFKPKAKVTIFEGEGRSNPGSHDDQIVPYRSRERLDDNNIGNGWRVPYQQRTDEREPVVDEKLRHMLYHGRGHVTKVYDNGVTPCIPRASLNRDHTEYAAIVNADAIGDHGKDH